jgi:hypothetical protein
VVKPKARLFPIQNHGYDFFTGVCPDGRQVVMGLLCPELVAFFFDSEGNYLGREERPWSVEAGQLAGREPPYNIFGDRFQEVIGNQLREWQCELGFRIATIRVKEFLDDEQTVGIEVLPSHYRDIETDTWFRSEEERQRFIESRDRWLERGSFVWWWAKDYFMSKDGAVESTRRA